MIFQIRNKITRHKLAEFESRDEVKHFLQSRIHAQLEVWILDRTPGELKEIVTAQNFIEQ